MNWCIIPIISWVLLSFVFFKNVLSHLHDKIWKYALSVWDVAPGLLTPCSCTDKASLNPTCDSMTSLNLNAILKHSNCLYSTFSWHCYNNFHPWTECHVHDAMFLFSFLLSDQMWRLHAFIMYKRLIHRFGWFCQIYVKEWGSLQTISMT